MNKLPCITSKCIKFPACRNRRFITCTPLREYCDEVDMVSNPCLLDGQDVWDLLYETFPNLSAVQLDQAPADSNITNVKDVLLNKKKIVSVHVIKYGRWMALEDI